MATVIDAVEPQRPGAARGARRWPAGALTHPLFLTALLALALNDHVLKGSALLPGVVTGKLSDVAGLLVAPVVLAWLCRVETRRGWIAAHLAVGAGFSLLQLAPVAGLVEGLTRMLGVGVRVWPDPTDLVALPALALSLRVFGRARRAPRVSSAVGWVALVFCTATAGVGGSPPPRYPFPPAGVLETDVFVRHTDSEDLSIGVRRLTDEVTVDCDELSDPPEDTLDGEDALDGDDFGDEQRWTLARGDAVPLWDRRGGATDRECYAVRLSARGGEWLVTWRHGAPATRPIDIRLEPNVPAEPDAVVIAADAQEPPRVPTGVSVRAP